mgnify:CR=1 FL=1
MPVTRFEPPTLRTERRQLPQLSKLITIVNGIHNIQYLIISNSELDRYISIYMHSLKQISKKSQSGWVHVSDSRFRAQLVCSCFLL